MLLPVLLAACQQETILLPGRGAAPRDSSAIDTSGTTTDTTVVQRVGLVLAVRVGGEDSVLANALGWQTNAIPGAEVTVQRSGSSIRQTDRTGLDGSVEFPALLPGEYRVSAIRILTPSESSLLGPGNEDVDAFGGSTSLILEPPAAEDTLVIGAGRRGSLVISEWSFYIAIINGTPYEFGGFLELYNNSDRTVYLDGKLFGAGFSAAFESPVEPCSTWATYRNDPQGVWTETVFRFPGSGQDYPVAPGQTIVMATDAIDHGQLVTGGLNLRNAQFEFLGSGDVDNPTAANMIDVGPRPFTLFAHGFFFFTTAALPFLADAVDLSTLPTARLFASGREYVRIPANKLLDVAALRYFGPSLGPACPEMVHASIDGAAFLMPEDNPGGARSVQRRVIGSFATGRQVLLRTRTSARDFDYRVRTPGSLPRP